MAEYPTELVVNIWVMNLDGAPTKSAVYGEVYGDNVLDLVSPDSLSFLTLNFFSLGVLIVILKFNLYFWPNSDL